MRNARSLSRRSAAAASVLAGCLAVAGLPGFASAQAAAAPVSASEANTASAEGTTTTTKDVSLAATPYEARVAALDEGHRVEDLSQRTETMQVFANPDGSWTSETATGPVRTRQDDGSWADIDTSLNARGDGFAPKNAKGDLVISGGGDKDLAQMTVDGRLVTWRWPSTLPEPVVDGNTATYRDVVAGVAGGDLVVTATPTGFSHDIVLPQAPTDPLSFTLPVLTSGAKLTEDADGDLSIKATSSGDSVVQADQPLMYDSSTDASGESANAVPVDATVTASAGTAGVLTLQPDQDYLTDPATQYPVTIDPTYTTYAYTDTWVQSSSPSGNGGSPELRAGTFNGGSDKARSYLSFPFGPWQNKTVTAASLRLNNFYSTQCTGVSAPIYVYALDRGWNESTLTWANQPDQAVGTELDGTNTAYGASGCTAAGEMSWNVSSTVKGWADGSLTKYGFELKANSETNSNTWRRWRSADYTGTATDRPKLTVTWLDSEPTYIKNAGDRPFFQYIDKTLSDRITTKANVGNGNLMVNVKDAKVAGNAGLDLKINHYYNSATADSTGSDQSMMSPGWSNSLGGSVRLEFNGTIAANDNTVSYYGDSGYRTQFDKNGSTWAATGTGSTDRLTYNSSDNKYRIKTRDKTVYVFGGLTGTGINYVNRGQLLEMRDKNGNSISYSYYINGALDTVTDTRGRTAVMQYTSDNGMLDSIAVRKSDGTLLMQYKFGYSDPGTNNSPPARLTSSWVESVNTSALPNTQDTVNIGAKTTYSYTDGLLTRIKDPRENSSAGNGSVTDFDYNSGKLFHLFRRTPDNTGQQTGESAPPDSTITFTYDATLAGTPCANNNDDAQLRTIVDGERLAPDLTNDSDDSTTYCSDSKSRVTRSIDANTHKRSKSFDANSNVATLDASGTGAGTSQFSTSYGTDGKDNPQSTTTPSGSQATASYSDPSSPNFPTSMRDFSNDKGSADATWDYDYDDNGNLIDATAKVKKENGDPLHTITYRYCWNGDGQLQRIDAPDSNGNSDVAKDNDLNAGCSTTVAQNNDTLFTYTVNGHLTNIDAPGSHRDTSYTYDALSRIKTMTDGRGVTTTYTYDALDHTVSQSFDGSNANPAPSGSSTQNVSWTYDAAGNQTSITDPNGTENFKYDELNRRYEQYRSNAGAPHKIYRYDPASNLISFKVDGDPNPTMYTYNKVNLLTTVDDPRTNSTGDQSTGKITFKYDRHDKRIKTMFPLASGAFVVQRSHYGDGGHENCRYSYLSTNSPVNETAEEDDPVCPDATAAGLITFRKYEYNKGAQETEDRQRVIEKGGVATSNNYDSLSRLLSATTSMGGQDLRTFQYTYDRHSNLTKDATTGSTPGLNTGTTNFAYNSSDELCWTSTGSGSSCASPPSGAQSYSYDGNGSLTGSSSGLSSDYNAIGQTASVDPAGSTPASSMIYTGVMQDDRLSKGDTSMSYGFSGMHAETRGSGASATTSWFIRDPEGKLLSMVEQGSGNTSYYLTDAQNSVVARIDANTGTTRRYVYEPSGERIRTYIDPTPTDNVSSGTTPPDRSESTTVSNPIDQNPWGYASGYLDSETGWLKFGTRYYQPGLSRWTQVDPKSGTPSNPLTLNPYIYAECNAPTRTDPSGRSARCLIAGGVAGAGGALIGGALGAVGGPVGVGVGGAIGAGAVGGFVGEACSAGEAGGSQTDRLQAGLVGLALGPAVGLLGTVGGIFNTV